SRRSGHPSASGPRPVGAEPIPDDGSLPGGGGDHRLGRMSRIVWGDASGRDPAAPAEIHYASPSEFMLEFAPVLESGTAFVRPERPRAAGDRRDLLVEIGFIARTFRMRAEVGEVVTLGQSRLKGGPPGFRLTLIDLPEERREELTQIVAQLRKGLAF